jgi:hypothetical protein
MRAFQRLIPVPVCGSDHHVFIFYVYWSLSAANFGRRD